MHGAGCAGWRAWWLEAQFAGEINPEVAAAQLAFEIHAPAMGGKRGARRFQDRRTFRKAWKANRWRRDEAPGKRP